MDKISISQKRTIPAWAADALALLGLLVYLGQSIYFAYTTVSNLDEGAYLLKGLLFATGKYHPFDPGISMGKAPLAFLIPGYVQLLFGAGVRTGRYLAIFFGVMAVIGLWMTARRVSNKWLAAAAVWVLASSPMVIKFYSGGATQSTIACLLAWMLFFSLGEKRSFWMLTLAGFLAGAMMFVRQNMMPVLPLLILYAFWQHGKKAWGLTLTGIGIVVFLFYIYWPDILQLWTWVPLIPFPASATYAGGGVPIRWQPDVPLATRLVSIFQVFRFHFVALTGCALSLLLLPKIKKWRSQTDLGMAIFLALLFWGLLYMHFEAAIGLDYCVFCFSPYVAFFNVAGILFVVVALQSWEWQPRPWRQILIVIAFMVIAAGVGFSAFETFGPVLLNLPAPRIRGFSLLPGLITWRELLSNALQLNYNSAMRVASTAFGLAAGLLLLLCGYLLWRRARWNSLAFGSFFASMILLAGIVFSPALHGNVADCDMDVIAANEKIGAYLKSVIPPGSLVYWDGGLSAAPLLYLPGANLFPPQINAGYTFFSSGETAQVIKFGYWNEELNEQWKAAADFFLVEEDRYARKWLGFFSPDKFDELRRTAPASCGAQSRIRVFHRK